MDTRHQTKRTVGIRLRLGKEIAAVYKRQTKGLSLKLVGVLPSQYHKRIVIRAGVAAHAGYRGDPLIDPSLYGLLLSSPGARKLHPDIILIGKIDAKAHGPFKRNAAFPVITKGCASCDHRIVPKDRIEKRDLNPGNLVLKYQL